MPSVVSVSCSPTHSFSKPVVEAISHWLHHNIEYRYMSGRPDLSAWDVLQRGYGVCRDFAHLAIALNRAFNLPARYVTGLSDDARKRIALNVNLDTVAGGRRLTALTSGFAGLEPFLLQAANANGHQLRCVRPLQTNSDHANFALAGIPAFRLVAGYDEAGANVRFVLTPGDRRDKVQVDELVTAAQLTASLLAAACNASSPEAAQWRRQS